LDHSNHSSSPGDGAATRRAPYRSKPGTYERVLKSALEDYTLSDKAYRLLMHLATKPVFWVIDPAQIAAELGKSERWWVDPALAELAAKGYVTGGARKRDSRGRITGRAPSALLRSKVIAPDAEPSASETDVTVSPAETCSPSTSETDVVVPPAETPHSPSSHRNVGNRRHNRENYKERTLPPPLPQEPLTGVPAAEATGGRETAIPEQAPLTGEVVPESPRGRSLRDQLRAALPDLSDYGIEEVIRRTRANPKINSATAVIKSHIKEGDIRDWVQDMAVKDEREQRLRRETDWMNERSKPPRHPCDRDGCDAEGDWGHPGGNFCERHHDEHRAQLATPKPAPGPEQLAGEEDADLMQVISAPPVAEVTAAVPRPPRPRLAMCERCKCMVRLEGARLAAHTGHFRQECPGSGDIAPGAALALFRQQARETASARLRMAQVEHGSGVAA
jgi:hypothetical protein